VQERASKVQLMLMLRSHRTISLESSPSYKVESMSLGLRPERFVLVALAGQTPAVITETLWALEHQRGKRVDEIRVITTSRGRQAITENLWGPDGHFSRYCQD
jgi:CRISPR-associated protein NE0113 (Cas_NE0113)